jgi:competence protein CoiA
MLRAYQKATRLFVDAESATKSDGPFICPDCGEEVLLRKSLVRICHFAHRNSSACSHSSHESEEHRRCKKAVYEALLRHPKAKKAALERSLKSVRPDVSAYINGVPVAIEVQLSALSLETIAHRTAEYAKKGIYVLWLAQWTPYLDGEKYSPRLWEKWVHAVYFGRVYYWVEGLTVIPYRFEPYYRKHGGVSRQLESRIPWENNLTIRSKRYKTAIRGKQLNIVENFSPNNRNKWEYGKIKMGPAKLFHCGRPLWKLSRRKHPPQERV